MSSQHPPIRVNNRKKILRAPVVLTRVQERNLGDLVQRLREELAPQGSFEEFLLEKLAIDITRLARLYEYDREVLQGHHETYMGRLQPKLDQHLINRYTDPFLRYKTSIEKDVKEGYSCLRELKKEREKAATTNKDVIYPSQKDLHSSQEQLGNTN